MGLLESAVFYGIMLLAAAFVAGTSLSIVTIVHMIIEWATGKV